jgi:cold shock CspA family protein
MPVSVEILVRGRVVDIREPGRVFGFIEIFDDHHEQVFFHRNDCHLKAMPDLYAEVEFYVRRDTPGKKLRKAIRVQAVEVVAA